jgi:phosphoserine aminotransferase
MLPTPEMPEKSIPGSTRVWIIDSTVGGGCRYFEELAIRRSNLLYDMIDGSGGFYNCFVTQERFRSRMQVVFTIGDGCALPVAAVSVCGWIGWHTARGLWRWRIMPAFANACAIRHLLLVPG